MSKYFDIGSVNLSLHYHPVAFPKLERIIFAISSFGSLFPGSSPIVDIKLSSQDYRHMKLTHLGNQYTQVTTDIETVETETELRFLGRTFKRRATKAAPPKFPGAYLSYRGVSYKA